MSVADKLVTVAENQQKVYDAGKNAEWSAFWDAFQKNGERTSYPYALSGRGWNDETFKPKYNIIIKGLADYVMRNNGVSDLVEQMNKCGIVFDMSEATSVSYACASTETKHLPTISVTNATKLTALFGWNSKLVTIDKLILKSDGTNTYSDTFSSAYALENITIEGVIGTNGFNISQSTNLTHDSIMSIINALADYSEDTSGTTWTVTIGSTNKAKLTAEELLIASDKGWTVK